MIKIVIVGAGAMGCLFAARLSQGGCAVSLVDVDSYRIYLLNREGICVHDDSGSHVVLAHAALAADVTVPVDLVMLFTKGMHSAQAVQSVAHLAGPQTLALTLQNGIGNAEIMANVFAPERIVRGVTDFPADLESPNTVASHGDGHVVLGGFCSAAHAYANTIAGWFNLAGLNASVDPGVQIKIWEKAAFNAALNALSTITQLPVGGLDAPPGHRIARAVVKEVIATAASKNIILDEERITGRVTWALANHRMHKPSMLQDRLAGRRTEIESINGAIIAVADASGIPVPVTRTLADIIRLSEASST